MSFRYKAFISYSHNDAKIAHWLHSTLEGFKTPSHLRKERSDGKQLPERLGRVFLDREELSSSQSLSERITEALSDSEFLIVICSPSAAKSTWVNKEIEEFKRAGGSNRVHSLIVAGDPADIGGPEDAFPPALRARYNQFGNIEPGNEEPIAADIRKNADGKKLAKMKILAGLLDIGLDELRRREALRRQKQMAIFSAGSLTIAVTTIVLFIAAVIARNEAEHEREKAEDLISFMLGDLRDRLQPVGRLDALDGVGQKALEYFSTASDVRLDPDTSLVRAKAMRQIGEVRIAQGRTNEGLDAFHASLQLLEVNSQRRHPESLFEKGQINFWIADAHFSNLELEQAHDHIQSYLQISQELVRLKPENSKYKLELIYAESNLGTLAFRANNREIARSHFNRALVIVNELSKSQPSQEIEMERAATISWLGAIEFAEGNLRASRNWYEKGLVIHQAAVGKNPNPGPKRQLGTTLALLGKIAEFSGHFELAHNQFEQAGSLFFELTEYDPQNFEWRRQYAWSLVDRARVGYQAGIITPETTAEILTRAGELISSSDIEESAKTARVFAGALIETAQLQADTGDITGAKKTLDKAFKTIEPYLTSNDRVRLLALYARGIYVGSTLALRENNQTEAISISRKGLEQISPSTSDHFEIVIYTALLAFLAKDSRAETLRKRVVESDFRGNTLAHETLAQQWLATGTLSN